MVSGGHRGAGTGDSRKEGKAAELQGAGGEERATGDGTRHRTFFDFDCLRSI